MAQKVQILLVDDLDGTELPEDKAETISFALDGTNYEIDLSEKNSTAMRKAFAKYVEAARKVGRANVRSIETARGRNRSTSSGNGNADRTKEIRAWAVDKGLLKADSRGRIPKDVVTQFESENGKAAANG